MSAALAQAGAGFAVFQRDCLLYLSYRIRFVTQLASGLFSVVLFYYLSRIVGSRAFESPDDYFAFAIVGIVVLQILAGTLTTLPASLRQELVAGTLERLIVSPFGPVAAIASMVWFPFLLTLLNGVLMLSVAAIAFGMPLSWSSAPYAIPVALLGALAFAPFALLVAAAVIVFKQAGAGATFVLTGMSLVGGFLFPVSLLPGWLEWLSKVQPFTPALDLLRHLLVGTQLPGSPWVAASKIALFAVLLLPISLWVVRLSIHTAQRRGTIIEY